MELVLDCGNTLMKVAVYENNIISELKIFENSDYGKIIEFIKTISNSGVKNISAAIISSVKDPPKEVKLEIKKHFDTIFLDKNTLLPIINNYTSKETLGYDRIASVIAGKKIFPYNNVLTINMGTCIIYDFINNNNEYEGGSISAGLNMRLKALNCYTGKLPLIKVRKFGKLIGNTTEESILSGLINGITFEIKGMIKAYKNICEDLKIIISGGDSYYFLNSFDKEILFKDNLVISGLHEILIYNKLNNN